MSFSTERLARAAATRPWWTIAIWAVLVVTGIGLTGALLSSATTEGNGEFTIEQESETAQNLLEKSGLRGEQRDVEVILIQHPTIEFGSPEFTAKINEVHAAIVALGEETVLNPTTGFPPEIPNPALLPAEAGFVGATNRAVRIPVTLADEFLKAGETVKPLLDLVDDLNEKDDGFKIGIFGVGATGADFREISERDLLLGESIGIFVAVIILIFVLRTVGSIWIPILIAILGIGLAFGSVSVIGQFYDNFPFFVTNFITMIGLAVGIDYTLFILARYREERARGHENVDAIAIAGASASRAVLFSGVTVVFALVGMLVVPTTIFFSMALGAILVVVYAVLLALILLPAILSVMGDKVNAWRVPFLQQSVDYDDTSRGFWNWLTRNVLRHPVIFMVATFTLLVVLTIPYFNINLGFNGPETFPDEFETKQTFDQLQAEFVGGLDEISPIDVVIGGDAGSSDVRTGVDNLLSALAQEPIFREASAYEVSEDGTAGILVLNLEPIENPDEVTQFIKEIRDTHVPAANIPGEVYIGGQRAFEVDFFDLVNLWTPIVLAIVLTLSFILLTVVFRSLIVPIKAIILNLLSVGAAYGLLVLVFQEGFLIDALGFQQVPVIEAWIPLFLFAILFGLSMDYEVFLLSRIRERFDQTGDNDESVAFGLRSTAAIITGAALIMVAVFWGFTLGDLVMFQQFGFGLAVAILVDATIIRSLLVPSTMKLLGKNNWYLPGWLNWLPDVRVEGGEPPTVPTAIQAD